ncbi:MAG: hypothetical protein EAZ08_13195 [Cytophagales bacterium]|nr:MAG: hypothetical protein EAZ08_13195 [Cytophagales bacterium]
MCLKFKIQPPPAPVALRPQRGKYNLPLPPSEGGNLTARLHRRLFSPPLEGVGGRSETKE